MLVIRKQHSPPAALAFVLALTPRFPYPAGLGQCPPAAVENILLKIGNLPVGNLTGGNQSRECGQFDEYPSYAAILVLYYLIVRHNKPLGQGKYRSLLRKQVLPPVRAQSHQGALRARGVIP